MYEVQFEVTSPLLSNERYPGAICLGPIVSCSYGKKYIWGAAWPSSGLSSCESGARDTASVDRDDSKSLIEVMSHQLVTTVVSDSEIELEYH